MVTESVESESRGMPPYISYATFTTLLEWLDNMPTLPHRFDRTLWADKFSGSTGAQIVSALRFLRLIDGEKVNERLEQLVAAKNSERKQTLKELLREAYGADFIDHLNRQTPGAIVEHLKSLGASDATERKAFAFLVNAAKALEIPLQGTVAKKVRNRPPSIGKKSNTPKGPAVKDNKTDAGTSSNGTSNTQRPPPLDEPSDSVSTKLKNGSTLTLKISGSLLTLSPNDRAFVYDIIDRLTSYGQKKEDMEPEVAINGR